MRSSVGRDSRSPDAAEASRAWKGFRRARTALWALVLLLIAAGAMLHDWTLSSGWARLLCISAAALVISQPLCHLLGFRCPRCRELFFATGGLMDFLGVHRLLWGRRCATCSLRAGHPDLTSDVPDSRPGPVF